MEMLPENESCVEGASTGDVGGGEDHSPTPGLSTVNSGKSTTAGGSTTEMLHHQSNLCIQLHHQLHTTRQQNATYDITDNQLSI